MGRTTHDHVRGAPDHEAMEDRGMLHRIDDELASGWLEAWADLGVRELEEYLAKHLAFLSFLDEAA
jgi:hypothetical protein